jgi:hypothetical protein
MFVNGERIEGAIPADELRKVLNAALREAGVTPPERPATTSRAADPAKNAGDGTSAAGAHDPKN